MVGKLLMVLYFMLSGLNAQAQSTFALTANLAGTGFGAVSSSPAGINCGAICTSSFAQATQVTLAAASAPGSVFQGWSGGGCSGTGTCVVTMSSAQTVTATFNTAPAQNYTLTVLSNGTGTGSISSNPVGINCGATCSADFAASTAVTLTATPSSGSGFLGWSGCLGAVGGTTCSVTMNTAKTVTANFNTMQAFGGLNLTVDGLGTPGSNSATVTVSGPADSIQQHTILTGTGTSLSDLVTGDYTVTAPSVVVSGTTYNPSPATQTVTVTTGSVTASVNYAAAPSGAFALTANKAGGGTGTVSSSPAGINCGASCSASFVAEASVILSAGADAGSDFAGWTGACTGTGICAVTMSDVRSVTADFNLVATSIDAAVPANAPQSATRIKGDDNVPMLAFTLSPTQATELQSITLQAAGTGNDRLDLTVVRLFVDANANGEIDAGETAVASGSFSADDGVLTLSLSTPLAINAGTNEFIVAADVSTTLAVRASLMWAANNQNPDLPVPWPLALLPVQTLGARRIRIPRSGLLGAVLVLLLASCGGGGDDGSLAPDPVPVTYQVSLTVVSASGDPTVTGVPLAGATITVHK